jgi:septal ring factor EnvC (AmiA/AmiB activator)
MNFAKIFAVWLIAKISHLFNFLLKLIQKLKTILLGSKDQELKDTIAKLEKSEKALEKARQSIIREKKKARKQKERFDLQIDFLNITHRGDREAYEKLFKTCRESTERFQIDYTSLLKHHVAKTGEHPGDILEETEAPIGRTD